MDPRYARNVPALSEAECELLRRKRVLVVGCGGLGGHLIDMLARIGIGSVRVVDGDVFEPSNLNRQLLSEVSLLGVGKAQTAAERVRRVNPDVAVHAVGEFLTEENAAALLTDCDAVLDIRNDLEATMKECREVTEKYRTGRSAYLRLGQLFMRLFAGLL